MVKCDPDDIGKDSQGVRIYNDDNPNNLDTKHCQQRNPQRNEDIKDIFILVIHFQMPQLFKAAIMWIYCRRTPSLDEL